MLRNSRFREIPYIHGSKSIYSVIKHPHQDCDAHYYTVCPRMELQRGKQLFLIFQKKSLFTKNSA